MTPPEATQADQNGPAGETPPAVSLHVLETLRKRNNFLAANHGKKLATRGFILQARKRGDEDVDPHLIRVGYTCSKKLGNAVARNRAKRRLREVARLGIGMSGVAGWDYVLIGRFEATVARPFDDLLNDLRKALRITHGESA